MRQGALQRLLTLPYVCVYTLKIYLNQNVKFALEEQRSAQYLLWAIERFARVHPSLWISATTGLQAAEVLNLILA